MTDLDPSILSDAEKREFLRELESAIFRGAVALSYDGKQVTYRSLQDMQKIRDMLRADLGIAVKKASRFKSFRLRGVSR